MHVIGYHIQMDVSLVRDRLRSAHGDLVDIDESTYVGFKRRATFIDREFGRWDALVYAVCRGTRHPERFRTLKRIGLIEAEKRLLDKHGDVIKIKPETWSNGSKTCTFVDVEFGEFENHLCNVLNGIGHPLRVKRSRSESQRLSIDQIRERVRSIHRSNVEVVGPYISMCHPCLFRDIDFGEFTALPVNVCRGTGHIKRAVKRREQTSIERFGVNHPMQNTDVFLKHSRKQRHHYRAIHWRTQQDLDCIGTWELATVRWLNERQIDFIWQPKAFRMPDGRTYRPDAYIIDMDLWIDIKGYFPEVSKKKCEWFKSIMPNFEIWSKDKLLEHGILTP